MRNIFLAIIFSGFALANSLTFQSGKVMVHTSVFGDSTIDPESSVITSHLTINGDDITTIKGSVDVSLVDLKSDNSDRDEHMYEAIDTKKYTKTTYTINSISPNSAGKYNIYGTLNLHGVAKKLDFSANITKKGKEITITGETAFKMSDFGITPPKLLFLTVRDLLELKINTTYKVD